MSILTQELPNFLLVRDKKCPIKTDFKTWLIFSEMIGNGGDLSDKIPQIFSMVFYELPPNLFDALIAIMEFYGKSKKVDNKNGSGNIKRLFDFEYDAELIYSAFVQQYKIDLCDTDIHWWKFKALFEGLSEETHFMKVMQYRSMDLSKIKDKEQKNFYKKMKRLYRLPDNRCEEEKETDFVNSFEKLFG